MQRSEILNRVRSERSWDVIVIGGGATGLGTAVDAASRGYKTLLLESHDFAKGTSSRSTKLVHGGVRYLAQGRVGLVREALRERDILQKNAPELVRDLEFVIPAYSGWAIPYYGLGLKAYDVLAGKRHWERSHSISRTEIQERIPSLATRNLAGGMVFRDGQFDDARFAIALLKTLLHLGGAAMNYAEVVGFRHEAGRIAGVTARDQETGEEFALSACVVVNATGVFADSVRSMDDPQSKSMIAPSQGAHLVLDRDFLAADLAVLIPKTDDGRVLFAIPWHGKTLIGTTDTPVSAATIEPRARAEEVAFLLDHVKRYFGRRPEPSEVRSVFAGLRPLIGGSIRAKTSSLSRGHVVSVSHSGLVTITGGKWTTYRVMARDAVDRAATVASLSPAPCRTDQLRLTGAEMVEIDETNLSAIVLSAARTEIARTVEDVLARRTRLLFLDARSAIAKAEAVAKLLAQELGHGASWQDTQVREFQKLAEGYTLAVQD